MEGHPDARSDVTTLCGVNQTQKHTHCRTPLPGGPWSGDPRSKDRKWGEIELVWIGGRARNTHAISPQESKARQSQVQPELQSETTTKHQPSKMMPKSLLTLLQGTRSAHAVNELFRQRKPNPSNKHRKVMQDMGTIIEIANE